MSPRLINLITLIPRVVSVLTVAILVAAAAIIIWATPRRLKVGDEI